jgi:heat-inducible transcriptional repressor
MAKKAADKGLNERAQHLLKVLVSRYIEEGLPVGSKTLAQSAHLDVSPATIRNVMSELEDLGFVESPHTSAGRVPTILGYRFFVDSLIESQPAGHQALFDELQLQLEQDQNTHELVSSVSEFLSGVTKLAGIVTLPKVQQIRLRQLEFIPLSERRVLAILVTNEDEVQNRILHVHRDFNLDELRMLSNFFNAEFSGKDVTQVRQMLLSQIQNDRDHMNRMLNVAVEMAESLFTPRASDEDYILAGQSNLMGKDKLSNVDKLRLLFDAFTQKQEVLRLLDQCINTEGVQIFIGNESGYQIFDECSVVTSSYSIAGKSLGVLGVIGPTRMQYDRIIPIVDVTAKVMGAVLNSRT